MSCHISYWLSDQILFKMISTVSNGINVKQRKNCVESYNIQSNSANVSITKTFEMV
jgi:hypothetical protein